MIACTIMRRFFFFAVILSLVVFTRLISLLLGLCLFGGGDAFVIFHSWGYAASCHTCLILLRESDLIIVCIVAPCAGEESVQFVVLYSSGIVSLFCFNSITYPSYMVWSTFLEDDHPIDAHNSLTSTTWIYECGLSFRVGLLVQV